jgi:NADPH-dependent ferric siderophore reductase
MNTRLNDPGAPESPRTVQRVRHVLATRRLEVLKALRISPHFIRVTLGGAQLEGFVSASFDDHLKLMLPAAGQSAPVLPDLGPNGPQWPADVARPVMRDFTPRFYDPHKRELDVEFALHGEGPAADWAARAVRGHSVGIGGPRGSFIIPEDYDWHLLIGDETALPAISRRLEELPAASTVIAVIQLNDPADRRVFHTNANVADQWVSGTDALLGAVESLELPRGEGFAWAAGEAKTIASVRKVLSATHGLDKDHMRTAAYWKLGATAHHETFVD